MDQSNHIVDDGPVSHSSYGLLYTPTSNYTLMVIISATAFRRFKFAIHDPHQLVTLIPPTLYARWSLEDLTTCGPHDQSTGQPVGCLHLQKLYIFRGAKGSTASLSTLPQLSEICVRTNYGPSVSPCDFPMLTSFTFWNEAEDCAPGATNIEFNISETGHQIPKTVETLHIPGSLSVPKNGITGNLSEFLPVDIPFLRDDPVKPTHPLQSLLISYTNIIGDVADLKYCENLTQVQAAGCNVYGDLSQLPDECHLFNARDNTSVLGFTWAGGRTGAKMLSIPYTINMATSNDIIRFIKDQAQCTRYTDNNGFVTKFVLSTANWTPPSNEVDPDFHAALVTLEAAGITVITVNGISLI